LIGSPLALASEKTASKSWVKFKDIPALQGPNVRYIHGSAKSVDFEKKIAVVETANGEQNESYDFFVASSGLRRAWPVVPQSLNRNNYLDETSRHIKAVRSARESVVVIGGGKYLFSTLDFANISQVLLVLKWQQSSS
jgi:NADH dehydrogenase FAD-containing subunit